MLVLFESFATSIFVLQLMLFCLCLSFYSFRCRLHDNPFTGSESPLKLREEPSNILGFPVKSEETSSPQQILEKLYVPVETVKSSMLRKIEAAAVFKDASTFSFIAMQWLICDLSVASFRPGHLEPLTLFDRGGIHISLHFATDSAALAHPDAAAVVVISTVNTSALHVSDYTFQVAVPKVRRTEANSPCKTL